jgi:hypothetical protein
MQTIENKIINRIHSHGNGWCFTPKEFWDLGKAEAIRVGLFRLVRKRMIRRLANGLFDYPRKDMQLGVLSPSPDAVARALSLRDAIRIQPSGAYAANLLGLSEQVPARIVYLTDGASRCVKIGVREIRLKRTTPRNMATAGRISGTVIQAFKFIGKNRMTSCYVDILRKKLNAKEKKCLVKDRIHAPAWMHVWLMKVGEGMPSNA